MAHDIKYIDKLVSNSLSDYGQMPETNWTKFQSDFSGNIKPNFISNNSSYGITKNVILSVVSLSILTTGIFMYSEKEKDKKQTPVCKTAITKQVKISDDITYDVKYSANIEKIDSTQLNYKNVSSNKAENVIIRVEIPVYKKIEVRKKILINDTVQNLILEQ